jgi:hypothetical protein
MLFVLGMLNNLDIDAVEKWLRLRKKKRGNNAGFDLQEEMIESLDTLQKGDAWVWAPRLKIHKRFRARMKRTFDAGATPRPGQKVRKAKKLAAVDIARLGAVIAEAAQRLKDNDPKQLRSGVARWKKAHAELQASMEREIQRQLGTSQKSVVAGKVKEKIVVKQVEVIKAADLRRLEALVKKIDKLILRITGTNADLELHLSGLRANATKLQDVATRVTQLRGKKAGALVGEVLALAADAPIEKSWSKGDPLHHAYLSHPPKPAKSAKSTPPVKASTPVKPVKSVKATKLAAVTNGHANGHAVEPPEGLQPVHLRLLSSIAWWESIGVSTPDLEGVAFIAKTSTKSSAFSNNRSRLRAGGYIDYPSAGCMALTAAGRAVAPPPELPATNEALHDAILQKISPVLGRMLRVLIDEYPSEVALEELATRAGTSVTSSAFSNNRSWLRARGLATYPHTGFARATELLFPENS